MTAADGMRTCRKCGEEKPLDQFVADKHCVAGHTYRCKACHSEICKARYCERQREARPMRYRHLTLPRDRGVFDWGKYGEMVREAFPEATL